MKQEAMLYEEKDNREVRCYLCSHHCRIKDGELGFCRVRHNVGGILYTLVYGDAIAANVDPIEKKPLYHFLPNSLAYSIATIGCNFHCGFCQNWQISQASAKEGAVYSRYELMPEAIVEQAQQYNCASIAYTYTEPTIFFEYAFDSAKLASEQNIANVFVTNGYMTRPALDTIQPYLDAANVDLKSFRDDYYVRNCDAHLKPVLRSIEYMKKLGIWIEVTTLVIPGQNDSREELMDIAQFLADLGKEIPWHISRFHPGYQFADHEVTPLDTLNMAMQIGKDVGLRYVYLGNVPGSGNIQCYECKRTVVERGIPGTNSIKLKDGKCPFCGTSIEGVWTLKKTSNSQSAQTGQVTKVTHVRNT